MERRGGGGRGRAARPWHGARRRTDTHTHSLPAPWPPSYITHHERGRRDLCLWLSQVLSLLSGDECIYFRRTPRAHCAPCVGRVPCGALSVTVLEHATVWGFDTHWTGSFHPPKCSSTILCDSRGQRTASDKQLGHKMSDLVC